MDELLEAFTEAITSLYTQFIKVEKRKYFLLDFAEIKDNVYLTEAMLEILTADEFKPKNLLFADKSYLCINFIFIFRLMIQHDIHKNSIFDLNIFFEIAPYLLEAIYKPYDTETYHKEVTRKAMQNLKTISKYMLPIWERLKQHVPQQNRIAPLTHSSMDSEDANNHHKHKD